MSNRTLKDLLDYESGDSWNGTHFREISVAFNAASQTVTVTSTNEMYSHEKFSVDVPFDDVKKQVNSGELKDARYFGSFATAAQRVLPGLEVEFIRPGMFSDHVGKVAFKP